MIMVPDRNSIYLLAAYFDQVQTLRFLNLEGFAKSYFRKLPA